MSSYCCICGLILLYVSSYYYVRVLILLYVCHHTAIYVPHATIYLASSYYYLCVPTYPDRDGNTALELARSTTICLSSYSSICVLIEQYILIHVLIHPDRDGNTALELARRGKFQGTLAILSAHQGGAVAHQVAKKKRFLKRMCLFPQFSFSQIGNDVSAARAACAMHYEDTYRECIARSSLYAL